MDGWIKLHRKFLDWQWYGDPAVKDVFIHLLLLANIEDKKWQDIDIKRGQVVTSIGKISQATGHSVQQVRTAIKKLKSTECITQSATSKFTVFTVINYDNYQEATRSATNEQQTTNKQLTNEQQTTNKQLTNEQQTTNNNIRKKEYKKERKKNYYPPLPPEGGAPPDGGGCNFSQGNDGFEKKPKCRSFKVIIESYTQNEDLKTAILDFKEMRECMRKPLTEKALRMVLKKADELGNSDEIKIKLFEQSTEHGWLSLYPIKQEQLQQSRHPPQSSGNPFLDMLKDIEESEGNTVDISGNVAGNGNS